MASKINKKFSLDITGVLDMSQLDDEHDLLVEVEDFERPVSLRKLAREFDGKDVKISIGYKNEL